jgi:hypothetical protein
MKTLNLIKLGIIFSSLIIGSCTQTGNHDVIGSWECKNEYHSLSFFPDGDVAVFGQKCSWKPIDKVSVKIECPEGGWFTIAEFSLNEDKSYGNLVGFYNLRCDRRK